MAAPVIQPPWDIERLTPLQLQALKDFKSSIQEHLKGNEEDIDFVRWLVPKQWVVADAVTMYKNAVKFRKENGLDDNFLERYPKENPKWYSILREYYPDSSLPGKENNGRTFDGFQVIFQYLTLLDGHMLKYVPVEELNKFHLYLMEVWSEQRNRIISEKKQVAGAIVIADVSKLSLAHLSLENMKWLSRISEIETLYYPETQRKYFFVNSSMLFSVSFNFIINFIDPVMAAQMEVLGPNDMEKLFKVVPKEHIPKELGGTCDYDLSKLGGGDLSRFTNSLPKPFKVKIPPWKEFTKEVDVDKVGINLGWEFSTQKFDIGFEVIGPNKEQIFPYQRVNSNQRKYGGFHSVTSAGKYIFRWDNSYSLTASKTLEYSIFVDNKLYEREVDKEEIAKEEKEEKESESGIPENQ